MRRLPARQVGLPSARLIAMQRIHRPDLRPWIARDTIVPSHFLAACNENSLGETVEHANVSFRQFLDHCMVRVGKETNTVQADMDTGRHLSCDEESALCDGSLTCSQASDWLPDVELKSIKYLRRHPGLRANKVDYRPKHAAAVAPAAPAEASSSAAGCRHAVVPLAPPLELQSVIVMQVYRPTAPDARKSTPIVDMEIEVLSSQTLLDVRLNLCCASDLDIMEPLPESRKSAFFFIGNTFFNDTRAGCIDYSRTIRDWAEEPGRGIGPFLSTDMASAAMAHLPFQLGYPYLYVHQGDCEHWIVFKDVRLLLDRGVRRINYPKLTPVARRLQLRCDMCRTNVARWTSRENMRLAVDPGFFCDECERAFNWDSQNRKIGSFQSQSYVDKSVHL